MRTIRARLYTVLLSCTLTLTLAYGEHTTQWDGTDESAATHAELHTTASTQSHPHTRQLPPYHIPHTRTHGDTYTANAPVRSYEDIIRDALARHKAGTLRKFDGAEFTSESIVLSEEQKAIKQRLAEEAGFPNDPLPLPPDHYDPRSNHTWRNICPSVTLIRDQGNCDADWAAAVASAFSDRLCIQSNGSLSKEIAIEDILSCCGWKCGLGCNGGYSFKAWEYIQESGAVSGGDYGTNAGCLPYSLKPCELYVNGTIHACDSIAGSTQTPVCTRLCQNGNEWEMEKHYSYAPQRIANDTVSIQSEIFYHGSVTATIDLYGDFIYQAGQYHTVYSHRSQAQLIGSLTIKLLGYGVAAWSGNTTYWIAAPTWGSSWGEINGFFLIARGSNECNVENTVVGAMIRIAPVEGKLVQNLQQQKQSQQQPQPPVASTESATTTTSNPPSESSHVMSEQRQDERQPDQ